MERSGNDMYDISLKSEAPLSENASRVDWKLPVFLVLMNLIAIAVQWGTMSAKLEEQSRRQDEQDRHMQFIDGELRTLGAGAGEAKGFHDETIRRFDSIDRQLAAMERKGRGAY